jgi:hypothetical protein
MTRPAHALAATLALLGGLALAGAALASQFRTFGGYEVHYNAFRADFVAEEVAIRNGITRSATRALVIIAVRDKRDGGLGVPVEAEITLTVENRAGQTQAVRMKAAREADAVHYLGEFRIAGADTYRFDAEVRPGDDARSYRLRWSQALDARGR